MNDPQLFTPAEAAHLLKVPESWLRKKAAARVIPCTFVGKHLRFSSNDLIKIIDSGARRPATSTAGMRVTRVPQPRSRTCRRTVARTDGTRREV